MKRRDFYPEKDAVGFLEERTEQSGYALLSSDPAVFIPECMIDVAEFEETFSWFQLARLAATRSNVV